MVPSRLKVETVIVLLEIRVLPGLLNSGSKALRRSGSQSALTSAAHWQPPLPWPQRLALNFSTVVSSMPSLYNNSIVEPQKNR